MGQSIVEVEITGPLTSGESIRIREEGAAWCFKGHFDRYMINFTTAEMRSKQLDLRARVTNGSPELVVKHGEWGSGKRIETIVQCERGQFESLVKAIVAIGFLQGIGCRRIIERFTDDEVEFSIIEVPRYTTFYEAELLAPVGEEDVAMDRLLEWARSRCLRVFTKEEFLKFIDDLDANANDLLCLDQEAAWDLIKHQTVTQT